jgi:hypothetical protein
MTHPTPTHPPTPAVPGTPKFRVPGPRTAKTSLIDCGRAWGEALAAIARLLTGRPV